MALMLALAAFVFVTAITVSGYYLLTAETAAEQRLRTVVQTSPVARPLPRDAERTSLVRRLLEGIGRYGFGGNEKSLAQRLSTAGLRGSNAVATFVGIRTLMSFGPALAYLLPHVSAGDAVAPTLFRAALICIGGHLLCNFWLRRRAVWRSRKLMVALPDSLDLMVVCLEGGLGLSATIARVGQERSALSDPLGVEFLRVARELQDGRPREEALRALADRNGVEDLKALVSLIIQSDRLGASMAKTLRAHADTLRTKRRQRAEEAARKLPIKMLFPLALLILPPLFVVTVGPAIIQIATLVPTVQGSR
jgi:tight adherence protein C